MAKIVLSSVLSTLAHIESELEARNAPENVRACLSDASDKIGSIQEGDPITLTLEAGVIDAAAAGLFVTETSFSLPSVSDVIANAEDKKDETPFVFANTEGSKADLLTANSDENGDRHIVEARMSLRERMKMKQLARRMKHKRKKKKKWICCTRPARMKDWKNKLYWGAICKYLMRGSPVRSQSINLGRDMTSRPVKIELIADPNTGRKRRVPFCKKQVEEKPKPKQEEPAKAKPKPA